MIFLDSKSYLTVCSAYILFCIFLAVIRITAWPRMGSASAGPSGASDGAVRSFLI